MQLQHLFLATLVATTPLAQYHRPRFPHHLADSHRIRRPLFFSSRRRANRLRRHRSLHNQTNSSSGMGFDMRLFAAGAVPVGPTSGGIDLTISATSKNFWRVVTTAP